MLESFAALPSNWLAAIGGLFGLLVGSFLNVVIYRYPVMLKHSWTSQSKAWLEIEQDDNIEPPTLSKPASHCSNCKAAIKPYQNIPIISWLLLGGKCANCKTAISIRYPSIELLTAILSTIIVYKFGFSLQAGFGLILTWVLVALTFIDFDHQLLPDDIVIPTLWLGLAINLTPVFTDTSSSVIGAIAGYLVFWIVFHIFRLLTGKEGMGHGDFKLMALLGAWLGWAYLPQIILVSTLVGSVVGIGLMIFKKAASDLAIPFGPYIAAAGWIAMVWGSEINQAYLNFSGI